MEFFSFSTPPIPSCSPLPQGSALVGPGLSKNPSLFCLPPQPVLHTSGKASSLLPSVLPATQGRDGDSADIAPLRLALSWGPLVAHHVSRAPAFSGGIWERRSPLLKREEFYNPVISLWLRGEGVYEFLGKIFFIPFKLIGEPSIIVTVWGTWFIGLIGFYLKNVFTSANNTTSDHSLSCWEWLMIYESTCSVALFTVIFSLSFKKTFSLVSRWLPFTHQILANAK